MGEQHGPGVRWLAEVSGRDPGDILADPRVLGDALGAAGDDLAGLARRLSSSDPVVRAAAQAEAELLRADMAAGPSPGDRFRTKLKNVLDQTLQDLREEEGPSEEAE